MLHDEGRPRPRHLSVVKDEPKPIEQVMQEVYVDDRWIAQDDAERTVLAHLRGWCHFGPRCAICIAQRDAFTVGQKVESTISGE